MGQSDGYETGERLRLIAERLYGGNLSDLARALDMKPPSFSKYTQGRRRPGTTVLERLTRLGVRLHWFLTGEGPMMRAPPDSVDPLPIVEMSSPAQLEGPDGLLYRVPLVQVGVDEGGSPQLEEIGAPEWLAGSFIRSTYGVRPEQVKGFRISGDAMEKTITPGDRVRGALWEGESLDDGAIYLFYTPNGTIVRRVWVEADSVRLTAERSEVKDLSFETDGWAGRLRPIARILEVTRPL